MTSRTITSMAALEAELQRVRDRGYAIATEELEDGFVAVGAPVRSRDERVVAAISAGVPAQRMSRERVELLGQLVRASADRISRTPGSASAAGDDTTSSSRRARSSSARAGGTVTRVRRATAPSRSTTTAAEARR